MSNHTTTAITPPSASADRSGQRDQQVVVFSMSAEQYALPITTVREIIRYERPRPIEATNSLIQGIIKLRERVLPVCDLSQHLGRALDITDATRILIIDTHDGAIGLIVDHVDEVKLVTPDQIEELPITDTGVGSQVAKIDDRLVIVFDSEQTFAGVLTQGATTSTDASLATPIADALKL